MTTNDLVMIRQRDIPGLPGYRAGNDGLFEDPDLQTLTKEAKDILFKAKERIRPVATFLLFSGGNDSTTLFELMHPHVDAAVHIATGIGIARRTGLGG